MKRKLYFYKLNMLGNELTSFWVVLKWFLGQFRVCLIPFKMSLEKERDAL